MRIMLVALQREYMIYGSDLTMNKQIGGYYVRIIRT